ncbi:hypothetical protein EMCRGX_G024935 [Ephydatia muelleri]
MDVRGHAKCVRSRWSTSLKWTVVSRGPDVSNWMLEAMPSVRGQDGRHHQSGLWLRPCQVYEVKMADITEVDRGYSRGPDVSNWIGHAKCVRSRWPTSLKWTKASRGPDVSNWIGHAKCAWSRWPTSPKWTVASRGPDVSNWMLEAMPSV